MVLIKCLRPERRDNLEENAVFNTKKTDCPVIFFGKQLLKTLCFLWDRPIKRPYSKVEKGVLLLTEQATKDGKPCQMINLGSPAMLKKGQRPHFVMKSWTYLPAAF
jgi:hypothetical protein